MVVQEGWIPDSSGMTEGQVGDGGEGRVVRLWGFGLHSVLSVLEGLATEGPGLSFQGAGGQPGSAPCSCCDVADKRRVLARGHLYHQFWLDPFGGVGSTFSRYRRWV